MQSSPRAVLFHGAHAQALALEVSILERILRNNRAAQGCTKYYQRLRMACRCLQRHRILDLLDDSQKLAQAITAAATRKTTQKKRQEIFWEFTSASKRSTESNETDAFAKALASIRQRVAEGLPECLSRLDYASEALLLEMARGFFLPLCSIAIAAVARIRLLLQNLACQILQEYPLWQTVLQEAFGNEVDSSVEWNVDELKELSQRFAPTKKWAVAEVSVRDQTQEVLRDLGLDAEAAGGGGALVTDTQQSESVHGVTINTPLATMEPAVAEEPLDVGELLPTHHGASIEEEDLSPDYFEVAAQKIKEELSAKSVKKTVRGKAKTSAKARPKVEAGVAKAKLELEEDVSPVDSQSVPPAKKKEKKKKRKKSSEQKSGKKTKKGKQSGNFFDSLFR
jgi:hypothetical protein